MRLKLRLSLNMSLLAMRLTVLALLILSSFLFFAPVCCAEPARLVKVCYFPDSVYMSKAPNGSRQGYDIDYLYELARYANWKYEFVEFKGFNDAFAALKAGSIDLMPALFRTEERARQLLFSEYDMGRIYVTLSVPNGDDKHLYEDYGSFNGMRVGILRDSEDGAAFRRWAADKKLKNISVVKMSSSAELMEALDSGRLDAAAVSFMGVSSSCRTVAEFAPQPIYFGVARNRPELLRELNKAMNAMSIGNPTFQVSLSKKYFSVNTNLRPVFSRRERDFILRSAPVKVSIQLDNAPFSYLDRQGRLVGAIPDLYRRLAELSGLRFTFVPADSMMQSIKTVSSGRADILGKVTSNLQLASSYGVRLTNDYMSMTMTRVSLKNTGKFWKIGVPRSLATVFEAGRATDGVPAADAVYYDNNSQTFNALKRHEIDAAYLNTACANYLVNNSRTTDYAISTLAGYDYSIAAGVGPDVSDTLYSILNKCLRYTNSLTMNDLVLKYSVANDETPFSFVNRIPSAVIAFFAAFMAALIVILTLLVALLARHMRAERALVAEREKNRAKEEQLLVEKRANAEKMEFFGNISHDMRTPLNGILGFTDLALAADDQVSVKNYLDKIRISGELLLSLVNDTLTISKIENQKFALNPEILNSEEIIDCVVTPIRSAAAARGVLFTVDKSEARSGYIRADKLHLQKIFLNLLSNAVKFTPPGGRVDLVIKSLAQPQNGCNCQITVRDTGVGISREFLPRMFDPFAQERRADIGNQSGTGLGLAIVKRLVEAMDGTIEATSEIGRGTEFIVSLPLERLENYTPPRAAEADLSSLAGKTLLLCEDNDMNREIASSILSAKEIGTVCAENGKRGLELFAASKPGDFAAILMDLRMPVMGGREAARAIRALDRPDAASIPILALTADAGEETVRQCAAAGMNGHVSKPIDPQELFKALQQLLGREEKSA